MKARESATRLSGGGRLLSLSPRLGLALALVGDMDTGPMGRFERLWQRAPPPGATREQLRDGIFTAKPQPITAGVAKHVPEVKDAPGGWAVLVGAADKPEGVHKGAPR